MPDGDNIWNNKMTANNLSALNHALNHLAEARNALDKMLDTTYDLLNDEELKLLTDLGEHMHEAKKALVKSSGR